MKIAAPLLALALFGYAVSGAADPVPYEWLMQNGPREVALALGRYDCSPASTDIVVIFMEEQLRMKGILGADPDTLSPADRLYNARVRSMVWAVRIGCSGNNVNRYQNK